MVVLLPSVTMMDVKELMTEYLRLQAIERLTGTLRDRRVLLSQEIDRRIAL